MRPVTFLLVLLSVFSDDKPVAGLDAPILRAPSPRAVPITEGTEPPGNPPDNYSPCTTAMLTPFYYDIYAENGKIPSTAARQEVCVCKLLIQKLQKVQVPHCTRLVNKVWCPYARLLEYEFGLCNVGTSTSPQVTEWPAECTGSPEPTNPVKTTTPSPVKTTATPTPVKTTATPQPERTTTPSPATPEPTDPANTEAPSSDGSLSPELTDPARTKTPSPTDPVETEAPSPSETATPSPFIRTFTPSPIVANESSSNTAAIAGGSVASAASIGIVITITLRCRRKRDEKKHKRRHESNAECDGIDAADAAALASQLLSPLEDSPADSAYAVVQAYPQLVQLNALS